MSTVWNILTTGPVHLRRVGPEEKLSSWRCIILLLGETGVGKSNFLECLHGDKTLGIAGDQLEAVTKNVTAYELMNARCKPSFTILNGFTPPIYLVDTPGFSDSQISEASVIKLIQEWLSKDREEGNMRMVDRIYYFQRITDKRLSGSQIRVANLVKVLLGSRRKYDTYLITTMWDTMWTSSQLSQAEAKFEELSTKHWKAPHYPMQFYNSQESALEIIGTRGPRVVSDALNTEFPPLTYNTVGTQSRHQLEFSLLLYEMVVARMGQLLQRARVLDDDLAQSFTRPDSEELVSRFRDEQEYIFHMMTVLQKERDELYPAISMDGQEQQAGVRGRLFSRWWKTSNSKCKDL